MSGLNYVFVPSVFWGYSKYIVAKKPSLHHLSILMAQLAKYRLIYHKDGIILAHTICNLVDF